MYKQLNSCDSESGFIVCRRGRRAERIDCQVGKTAEKTKNEEFEGSDVNSIFGLGRRIVREELRIEQRDRWRVFRILRKMDGDKGVEGMRREKFRRER